VLWESIRNKITRKIIIFVLGGCKARGIPKGGFGRVLAIKAKKGEKFSSAASTGLSFFFFHRLTEYNIVVGDYFSLFDLLIFLALSETMYLSAPPTITCIPDLTEEFSVCTSGTLKRKG
jgi:hypothetical protein